MRNLLLFGFLGLIGLMVASAVSGQEPQAKVDEAYQAEIDEWHEQHIEKLTDPSGYLSLVGLFWLREGDNRFGSDTENEIILPADAAPPHAGMMVLDQGEITVKVAKGAEVLLRGQPVTQTKIHSDAEELPDVLTLDRLSMLVLERSGRLAVRVKDPDAATRRNFIGVERFPVNPKYRIETRLIPYDPPRKRQVPTVIGTDAEFIVPGIVRFEIDGVACELEPVLASPESQMLFFIFGDQTNGRTTYGAGRFLYCEREDEEGRIVIDFNKTVNPPCAFTHYATCPLPPPNNQLEVSIEAGERSYKGEH
jgi:uncharacterized protein (DUF1684 family)